VLVFVADAAVVVVVVSPPETAEDGCMLARENKAICSELRGDCRGIRNSQLIEKSAFFGGSSEGDKSFSKKRRYRWY
jgi:hypothetical protein